MAIRLYSYWRSTAAYRVRVALELKGIPYEIVPVSLAPGVHTFELTDPGWQRRRVPMLVAFMQAEAREPPAKGDDTDAR